MPLFIISTQALTLPSNIDFIHGKSDASSRPLPSLVPESNFHNPSLKDLHQSQICFDFTKNQCTRGSACKFSHDIQHIIQVNSQEKGICFDFLKGLCSRGLLCRFSHDISNLQLPPSQVRYFLLLQMVHLCLCGVGDVRSSVALNE